LCLIEVVHGQQRACMPVYIGKSGDLVGWHRCLTHSCALSKYECIFWTSTLGAVCQFVIFQLSSPTWILWEVWDIDVGLLSWNMTNWQTAPSVLVQNMHSYFDKAQECVRHRCHPTKSPLFPIYTGIQALCWPCTTSIKHKATYTDQVYSQYRHILTQYHQVPLIIHHLVRHSSVN
jgi:hypothetical protein